MNNEAKPYTTHEWLMIRNGLTDYLGSKEGQQHDYDTRMSIWAEVERANNHINNKLNQLGER